MLIALSEERNIISTLSMHLYRLERYGELKVLQVITTLPFGREFLPVERQVG